MKLSGKVHKFDHNVNTDVIIPARYCASMDYNYLASHCMEDIDSQFSSNVEKGDIIVAGENFGCGSSREVAPIAIKYSGISAVIAFSFARIFFRNAINIGLHVFCSQEAWNVLEKDEKVELNIQEGQITGMLGKCVAFEPYSPEILSIVNAGGLTEYVKKRIRKNGSVRS